MDEAIHVIPVDDLKPHNTCSDYCKCCPRVEQQPNGNRLIIHNSYDGREFFETQENNNELGQ